MEVAQLLNNADQILNDIGGLMVHSCTPVGRVDRPRAS